MTSSQPKVDIWMPIYIGDYLSATSRLTTEQHGAYILLLLDYWKNGPPPDNDSILCQIARLPVESWKQMRHSISSFFKISDGCWTDDILDERIEEARRNRQNASNRGKRGAEARYGARTNHLSIDEALLEPSTENGSSSSSSSSSEPLPLKSTSGKRKSSSTDSEEFKRFWSTWPDHPRKIRRVDAEKIWNDKGLDEHCDVILTHLKSCVKSKQWIDGFVPLPVSFLNQQRWLDGVPTQVPHLPFGRKVI